MINRYIKIRKLIINYSSLTFPLHPDECEFEGHCLFALQNTAEDTHGTCSLSDNVFSLNLCIYLHHSLIYHKSSSNFKPRHLIES
jgi:hypothetical protein